MRQYDLSRGRFCSRERLPGLNISSKFSVSPSETKLSPSALKMDPFSNTLRTKQVGPFRIVEKFHSPSQRLALHEHEKAYVSFLLTGSYVEILRQEERICSPGTVIWHPTTEAHADQFRSDGGHLLDLEIDSAWLDDASQALESVARAHVFFGALPYT